MGKTKTAFVKDVKDETKKSSFDELREKRERQEEKRKEEGKKEEIHIAGLKGGQRVKIIEAEPIITTEEIKKEEEKKAKKTPRTRGKKYNEVKAKVDRNKSYPVKEAIKLVRETSYSKFDGSMELHMVIKKTGLSVQVSLPHSAGKEKKVEIASDETVEKLKTGKIDFDILIATPDMMPKLVPYARILGPKGLMPNPKNGTLVPDIKKTKGVGGNTVTIKTEKEAPLIHTVIGKVSQKEEELEQNLGSIIKAVSEKQIEKAYLKATMSPSVRLKI
jgi:large subunit ribosomal protein L1